MSSKTETMLLFSVELILISIVLGVLYLIFDKNSPLNKDS